MSGDFTSTILIATGFFKMLSHCRRSFFNLSAALADDHARLCAMDVNANLGSIPFNFNLRNAWQSKLLFQRAAKVVIFNESVAEVTFFANQRNPNL